MSRLAAAIFVAALTLNSFSAFAQARVAVGHYAPFADTTLFQCPCGSFDMSDTVECSSIGQIDWEILGCVDATATVALDGQDPVLFEARQLTLPFPCENDES